MSKERERFDEIAKKIKRETDHSRSTGDASVHQVNDQMRIIRRSSSSSSINNNNMMMMMMLQQGGPAGTLNTITPCAACKLLRRRCAQECPFSPYFSPHEPHKFASVHKVFGASNVSKMLMEVAENQRADTANSLVYEANVRLRDPVYGCMGAISALQHQIQSLQAELNLVRAQIFRYKYSHDEPHHNNLNILQSQSHHHHHIPFFSSSEAVSVAIPPPILPPLLIQPPPPPPSSSAAATASSSSMYTDPTTTADYTAISSTNDHQNVPYFTSQTHDIS